MSNKTDQYEYLENQDEAVGLPAQLRDPLGVLRRQHRWILTTIAIMSSIVAGATAFVPLRYEARATILLTAKSIPDVFVPTTILAGIVEQFDAIHNEVFSRDHLSRIIQETGVYAEEAKTATRAELVDRLRNELTVTPVASGPVSGRPASSAAYELRMTGWEPKILAEVVNRTVAHFIDQNIEYRGRQARLTTQFMQREFEHSDTALREHQRKLAEFREKHRGALPEDRITAISRLERLEEQRRSSILRLNDFQSRLDNLDSRPQNMSGGEDLESLSARLRNARTLYTEDHPRVRSLERQVRAAESSESPGTTTYDAKRHDERSQIEEGVTSEHMRLAQIDEEVARLETLLAETPKIEEEYAALVRLEQILQENYVEYLRKVKSAELSLSLENAQQGAQLARIDVAVVPTAPIVARWQIAAGGFAAVLGLAILVGIGRELLNPVIIDEQHLEDAISIPLLGSIAKIA